MMTIMNAALFDSLIQYSMYEINISGHDEHVEIKAHPEKDQTT